MKKKQVYERREKSFRKYFMAKTQKKLDKRAKIYGWICSIFELIYIPISVKLINYIFRGGFSVLGMVALMAIPHIVIALIDKLFFFKPLGKKYTHASVDNHKFKDATFSVLICFINNCIDCV